MCESPRFEMSKRTNDASNGNAAKRARTKTNRFGTRESSTNYNHFFDSTIPNNDYIQSDSNSTCSNNIQFDTRSLCQDQPMETVLSLISIMSTTIVTLTNSLETMANDLRRIKTISTLEIGNSELKEEEKPLLEKFQSFDLPINSMNRLLLLESDLANNMTFRTFFVRLNCEPT